MARRILQLAIILPVVLLSCQSGQNNRGEIESETTYIENEAEYVAAGIAIAAQTQGVLSNALMKAMQDGGVPEAISYCNINALNITDSLSELYGAEIQRISDKNRNPQNQADADEIAIINRFKEALMEDVPQPVLVMKEDKLVFYHAIISASNCLVCHGKVGETMEASIYELISNMYPGDKATGYEAGEVRGAWKISFNQNN
jgi:hypothetical protein